MNVVEPILFHARLDPPAPAMFTPETSLGTVTYGRLARFIHSVGHRAIRLGIAPNAVVAIQIKDPIFHTAVALGLMQIGVATVSVSAPLPKDLSVDVFLTDAVDDYSGRRNTKVVGVDLSWLSGKGIPVDERRVYRGDGDDVCRITFTLGATGEARAVGFTHNNQLKRVARCNHLFGKTFPECSRFFSSYGLGSSSGFLYVLYVLSRGGTIYFPGASLIETLQTFDVYKVQGLIASPGNLSDFLSFYDDNPDFRSSFGVILSAGSPLSRSLSERVRSRMGSNLVLSYGTTETSTISAAPAHALYEGAAGYIAPGVSIRAVDDEGTILEPGNEGSLQVQTPVNVDGYLNEVAKTESPFLDGYFDTGDIGYVTTEKMLVITGRKKEVLNLGGEKVSPRIIEDVITNHDSVREALAFAVPSEFGIEEVWALTVSVGNLDEDALQLHCRGRLPKAQVPVRFINVAELPRTESEEVDRHRLDAMVRGLTGAGG